MLRTESVVRVAGHDPFGKQPSDSRPGPGINLVDIGKTQIASPVQLQQRGNHTGGLLAADLLLRPESAIRIAVHKTRRQGRLNIFGKPILAEHILEGAFTLPCRHLKSAVHHGDELGPGHSAIRSEAAIGVALHIAGGDGLFDLRSCPVAFNVIDTAGIDSATDKQTQPE